VKHQREKITFLVSEISKAAGVLRDLAGRDRESFLADVHLVSSARYNFIVAIEGMIDTCNHIISQNGLRAPSDYADTFSVCGENSFFTEEQVTTFSSMARFRNRLVHIYWDINDDEIYNILKNRLDDFEHFIQAVLAKLNI
jgi:uncharacterized protein YutE (UPF0331/DUF86 family)